MCPLFWKLLISMYFLHQYDIVIGKYKIDEIESLKVRSSWRDLTDTAEIVLPRNLTYMDKRLDEVINRRDPVTIRVGHNGGNFVTEFEGYVREVEPNTPIVILCEDEMMNLKKGNITKVWKKVNLSEIINFIAPGYQHRIQDATLSYACKNQTPAQILLDLREYGIFSYFRKIDGVQTLISGFPYQQRFSQHVLHMQKNIQGNDLKFRSATDYRLRVKAIANLPTGKKTIEYFPSEEDDGSELITLNYGEISTNEAERKKQLVAYAQAEYSRFKVDGYRGDVVLWKVPVIKHGDQVVIKDALYPEREGTYLVDGTVLESAEPYVKRTCEIGPKVSAL
jgi:hypothetical protein